MTTLPNLIAQAIEDNPEFTVQSISEMALDLCSVEPWRSALMPLIYGEVVLQFRHRTARHEKIVFNGTAADPLAARKALLSDGVWVPGRGESAPAYTTWGKLTEADHEARIAYLQSLVDGNMATIERHREAIAQIQAAGATCLDDISEAA